MNKSMQPVTPQRRPLLLLFVLAILLIAGSLTMRHYTHETSPVLKWIEQALSANTGIGGAANGHS